VDETAPRARVGSVRRAATAAASLLLARAEFAAVELTQSGADALRWLLWALVAMAMLALTLVVATAAIVLVLWDRFGWVPAAFLALSYAAATAYLMFRLDRALRACRPLMAQTLAELSKDREALFGRET